MHKSSKQWRVAGGVVISYPWASHLLYRATGSEPPARRTDSPRKTQNTPPSAPEFGGLEEAFRTAASQVAGWKSITVRFSTKAEDPWSLSIDRGHGARPDLRSQIAIDRTTGEILRAESYSQQVPGQKSGAGFDSFIPARPSASAARRSRALSRSARRSWCSPASV